MNLNGSRIDGAAITGNLNGLGAGTQTGASKIAMQPILPGSLCAEVTVDAETNTIELFADWQVSRDGSTWLTCASSSQNAANVVLATGTAGADAAVTKILPAPDCVYSWPFARVAIRNEVVAGNTVDTYSVKYIARRA